MQGFLGHRKKEVVTVSRSRRELCWGGRNIKERKIKEDNGKENLNTLACFPKRVI